MEFPHLGKHCNEPSCNKLDFLPVKCDACSNIFCSDHYSYLNHNCSSAYKHDLQVPICPLCGDPVPTPRDVLPDITVGQHIDKFCKSDTKKIFTNRCTFKNCKKKELLPFKCSQCTRNFCIRHRHFADHECVGSSSSSSSKDAKRNLFLASTEKRLASGTKNLNNKERSTITTNNYVKNVQGNMTEDEALAKALAQSIIELDESANRNQRNSNNTQVTRVPVGGGNSAGGTNDAKDKCSLS